MVMYNPPHPGEVLKETLIEGCRLSVTEAAQILGISRPSLSKLLNRRGGLSAEMAVRLSVALNTSSDVWFHLQAAYELWDAEKKRHEIAKEVQRVDQYIESHRTN